MCLNLEIEIVTTIYVDIDDIIENFHLTSQSTDERINNAIETEIIGWPEPEYYLVGTEEKRKIFLEIRNRIGKQISFGD